MEVRATVLCDNLVYGTGGIAEHGWAVWLETLSGNYLFDTGQGMALLHNVTLFGKDLTTARSILISHHHYDHTGGLLEALRVMRGGPGGTGVPVYAHFDLFKESYSMPKGKRPRHIGIPFSRAALEGAGAIFALDKDWREIEDGIYMTGEVPRETGFVPLDPDLKHFDEQKELVSDPVLDDQALVIETHRGLFIVLGCSHAGIINILNYAVEKTGRSDIHTIIGGTHLRSTAEEHVTRTIKALLEYDIGRIGVSHCTGPEAAAQMMRALGDRFFFCQVGSTVEL